MVSFFALMVVFGVATAMAGAAAHSEITTGNARSWLADHEDVSHIERLSIDDSIAVWTTSDGQHCSARIEQVPEFVLIDKECK